MTDLSVAAHVTRSQLGLGNLDINDHTTYAIAGPAIMGGGTAWDRKTVNAPWVDGDITVARRRQNVMEQLLVYVAGSDQSTLMSNLRTLRDAFTQDRYTLQITVGSAQNAWDCEAADYSMLYDTAHAYNKYVVATFQIPRKPVPLVGGF